MIVRPTKVVVIGSNKTPTSIGLAGKAPPRVHVDGNIVRDHTALARVLISMAGTLQETTITALANPFAGCVLLSDLVSVNGIMIIDHMLGRQYTGWLIARPRGVVTIVESNPQPASLDPTKQIQFQATPAGVTFDLLMF